MKWSRLFAFAFLVLVGISPAIAQESIQLRFEVTKDGSTVANPEMSVNSGSSGKMEIANVGRVAFTPTFRGSDVVIAFEISSGGKQFQPRLVISKNEPGSISWTSEARTESFKLTVYWVR